MPPIAQPADRLKMSLAYAALWAKYRQATKGKKRGFALLGANAHSVKEEIPEKAKSDYII